MRFETKFMPLSAAALEFKSAEGMPVSISGYASTFGGEPDSYNDIIAPGAFSESVKMWAGNADPLPMLFNHDPNIPLGTWPTLFEDARGLRVEGEFTPDNDWARNVASSVRHRAVRGLSIGFRTKNASQGQNGVRILEAVELHEVSVVTFPANRHAQVGGIKSDASAEITTLRDFEVLLRDLGWSRREAEAIAVKGFKTFLAARDEPERDDTGAAEKQTPLASNQRRDGEGARAATLLAALREWRVPTPL